MPTKERKTSRRVQKLTAATPIATDPAPPGAPQATIPPPEQLLAESATQLQKVQAAIQVALEQGTATPALARESASIARAIAILSKELRDREKATKDRFEKLTDKERHELGADLVCSYPRAVRVEIHRRLEESLAKKGTP